MCVHYHEMDCDHACMGDWSMHAAAHRLWQTEWQVDYLRERASPRVGREGEVLCSRDSMHLSGQDIAPHVTVFAKLRSAAHSMPAGPPMYSRHRDLPVVLASSESSRVDVLWKRA